MCDALSGFRVYLFSEENMNRISIDQRMNSGLVLRLISLVALVGFVFVLAPAGASAAKSQSIKPEAFFISLDTEKKMINLPQLLVPSLSIILQVSFLNQLRL